MSSTRQLAAIMFTDIVGYTALMGKDEQKAFQTIHKNRQIHKSIIERHKGKFLKEIGDGILASFPTVSDAVYSAVEIRKKVEKEGYRLRIGIHLGEVVFEKHDVFGDGVNIASRIQAAADEGEILVSESVYRNIANKKGLQVEFLREQQLKNVDTPIKISRVTTTHDYENEYKLESYANGENIKGKNRTIIILTAAIILLVAGYFLYPVLFKNQNIVHSTSAAASGEKSLAVLPFKDNSATLDQEYLGNSIAEEILNVLNTTMKDLKVTGITSSFALKDSTLKAIGRILKVKSILEGSVQKSGNQVKVVVRLINEEDEAVIWTETFERAFKDLFNLQNEIAVKVGEKLKLTFEGDINTETRTLNPDAYEMVLKGNFFFNQGPEGLKQAIEYHKKAISIDPEYGYPYIRLGWALYQSTLFGGFSSKEGFAMSRKEIERGLSLTQSATEKESAHIVLAYINLWGYHWKDAWSESEKVLAINPKRTGFSAFYQSMVLGKPDTAITIWKKEVDINPVDLLFLRDLAVLQFQGRRFSEAKATCHNMLELNSSFSEAHRILGQVYFTEKKIDTALYHLKKAMDLGNPWAPILTITTLAYAGKKEAAQKIYAQVDSLSAGKIPAIARGLIYHSFGDNKKAYEWLNQSYEDKDFYLVSVKIDPLWDPLRSDPGFEKLIQKMNFPK